MKKIIIVAVSDNWAIGKDNKMPWHIPADLYWFKEVTTGHPVIMGSNTYKSIGKPLPNRTNIVVSHKYISGVVMAHNLKEAYSIAEKIDDQCFIIGGAQLYKSAINDADYLYVTHVHTIVEDADTLLPLLKAFEGFALFHRRIDATDRIGNPSFRCSHLSEEPFLAHDRSNLHCGSGW